MFESNFPVDKGMFSYAILWNAFKRRDEIRHSRRSRTVQLFSRTT